MAGKDRWQWNSRFSQYPTDQVQKSGIEDRHAIDVAINSVRQVPWRGGILRC